MLFNSYIFIFAFLPITLFGYYSLNHFQKYELSKGWLFICSLVFYGYINPFYLVLLLSSILINYIIHYLLIRQSDKQSGPFAHFRLSLLLLGILGNLAALFYFKYSTFFLSTLNQLFHTDYVLTNIILPLGISFFTFQQIAFLIDSYKRETPLCNLLNYGIFVAFFPQLSSGPISLHNELLPQFIDPLRKKFNAVSFSNGLRYFSIGLSKKVLLADTLGRAVQIGFDNYRGLNSISALYVMLAYTLQIYFDFSGYSDMAIGLGKMFNIDLPINFYSPYKSASIGEFWKRWHITLTKFFTKYLYIPLGGSKCGKFRTYINIFIVFLFSGLWHGANWTFIVWGLLHGIALILYRIFQKYWNRLPNILGTIFTFIYVNMAWIVFRSNTLIESKQYFGHLLLGGSGSLMSDISECLPINAYIFIVIALILIFATPNTHEIIKKENKAFKSALFDVILLLCSILSLSEVSTFLYYSF